MNKAVLIVCGVVVVACTGAWAPATAAEDQQCPTASTAGNAQTSGTDGANGGSSSTSSCPPAFQPKAEGPNTGPRYTVSKSVSPAGHVEPGETVTYTVTVRAQSDVSGAGFTDNLNSGVLDDASYLNDATPSSGVVDDTSEPGVISWAASELNAGDEVTVTYSVRVNEPDTGDGILRNDVAPGTDGECGTCAITNAVAGEFTVRETASPQPGSTVQPGDTVEYTVEVASGDAPVYAGFAESLSANADYTGDAKASDGTVTVQGDTLTWNWKMGADTTATVTFSATVAVAGGTGQLTSTVQPMSNDPYTGSCAAQGSCRVSYRVVGPANTGSTNPTNPTNSMPSPAPTPTPTRSAGAVPVSNSSAPPTSSVPTIADTGVQTAGLSRLAAVLLLGGLGLLVLGCVPRRRARHTHAR